MTVTIFKSCRVFDGLNEELIESASVIVEDERIREVTTSAISFPDARHIDCGGRVLMPGLIDAHFHAYTPSFNILANDRLPPSLMASHAAKILEGALRRGFTAVRDAAGADTGLWMATEQGLIDGPRLFFSGKAISQTGGHGDMRPGDQIEPCVCGSYSGTLTLVADGADEVRKVVREELRKGAHQIKLFLSGGVVSPTDPTWMPQFTEAEIRAAVEEAATRKTYVMAHCYTDDAARRCAEYGVRTIEHGSGIHEDTAKLIAEKGTYVVPTLKVIDVLRKHGTALGLPEMSLQKIKGLYESMVKSIEICVRAGVKLGLGTDLLDHTYHVLQGGEFALRGEVEKPIDVLRSATSINAEILQKEGELGCVSPEAFADILVLDFNPLQDLSAFADAAKNIPVIMRNGAIIKDALE